MMIIVTKRSTHSKRVKLRQDAMIRPFMTWRNAFAFCNSRDNSHSWVFMFSHFDLRVIAKRSKKFGRYRLCSRGLAQISAIFCKRFRLYSEVESLKNARTTLPVSHSPFVWITKSKFQSSIYLRTRLSVADGCATFAHFDNIFFWLGQDFCLS